MTRRTLVATAAPAVALLLCGAQSSCEPTASAKSVKLVYVEDHAPGWPVRAAVNAWRSAGVSRVHYGKCRAGAKCVRVYSRPISGTVAGSTAVLGGSIRLDSSEKWSAAEKRQITIHELGHALGAAHNNAVKGRAWSCMNARVRHYSTPCRITAVDALRAKS